MLMIYTLMFLLLLANTAAGCMLLYIGATTLRNRARFGTDTRPHNHHRNKISTVTTANTAFLNAWRHARETEEEIAPAVRF